MAEALELIGERKDGSTFPIEVHLNHVATPNGGHAIAFVTDITGRKRADVALQERTAELERLTAQLRQMASDLTLTEQRAREQLAKTLHDGLQQLLVIAVLKIDRLSQRGVQQGAASDELLRELRNYLGEAIEAARSLSFELFPPVLQTSGLPAALAWLADWTQKKYGLDVEIFADPVANSSRKDTRTLLFESVRELLFNAAKHAGIDRVTVDLSLDADDMLCITVEDKGIGFDPAGLVERAKDGKTGWGLFSIRERLALLGGRFDIESAQGRGTRFHLKAPRGSDQEVVDSGPPLNAAAIGSAVRDISTAQTQALSVLIVDDHRDMRQALRGSLQEHRELHVVGDAANGLEAITQARALHPDVIVMDVSMPVMDGVEATRHIRAELPSIRVIGLSMYSQTEVTLAIESAGAERLFTKGADTRRLIDHLLAMHKALPSITQPSQD
jgi:signal transduction histidine kinase/ActR/RegA family two-component response regulator